MLGIIGAMDVEVKKLREMMEDPETQTVAGMTFYQGTIKGKAVVVVRSGIGKVNAGLCSQILVDDSSIKNLKKLKISGVLDSLFPRILASFFRFMQAKVSPAFISIRAFPIYWV